MTLGRCASAWRASGRDPRRLRSGEAACRAAAPPTAADPGLGLGEPGAAACRGCRGRVHAAAALQREHRAGRHRLACSATSRSTCIRRRRTSSSSARTRGTGRARATATGLVTDQSDTLMIVHIPANRQWAEVMSDPARLLGEHPGLQDGQRPAVRADAVQDQRGVRDREPVREPQRARRRVHVKTVEQDTGIYIDHFVVVNFTGFKDMVAALTGCRSATRRRSTTRCRPAPAGRAPPADPGPGARLRARPGTPWATAATWSGSAASRRSCRR